MNVAVFFGTLSALALVSMSAEYVWSRRRGLGWHAPRDTLANLNLAAGNLVLGTLVVTGIVAAYTAIWAVRPIDLRDHLPAWVFYVVGFLLAELLQYWNHRLSHVWNPLVWGHITHHSSPHLNLSTAVRVNWFYRAYAWLFYLPLPLLGYTATEFVALQTLMNGYNLFQHTRLDVPFGPLEYVLVSPRAHRLHHSADPDQAGNYGASLIVFDRLFGTYREVEDESTVQWGLPESVASSNPLTMNFQYLADLWVSAQARGKSFLATLLGTEFPSVGRRVEPGATALSGGIWAVGLGLIAVSVALNAIAPKLPPVALVPCVAGMLVAIVAFGAKLDRLTSRG